MGPRPTVFLSYASQDREAARLLRECLLAHGLDPWFDESGLGGGEEWDGKIRRQIRECDYFMPVVSAQTEARHEGYFRREWRLAVERTLDMADDHAFLLPVVIDDTPQAQARVPEKFLTVQWLKVPGGQPTGAFTAMLDRVVQGSIRETPPPRTSGERPRVANTAKAPPDFAPFPKAGDGGTMHHAASVIGWIVSSLYLVWRRVPRWIRLIVITWAVIALVSRCNSSSGDRPSSRAPGEMTPARLAKLRALSDKYKNANDADEIAKLASALAREFADNGKAISQPPLLAIAFTAPAGDVEAEKLANTAFAMTYGKVSMAHKGLVGLAKEPQVNKDSAVERGRGTHSSYVLFGSVDGTDAQRTLNTAIVKVADGSIVWSKSYPPPTDNDKIAAEIDAHVPALDED